MNVRTMTSAILLASLAACGRTPPDPRGVDHDEVLLQVRATGRAESRPDEARFTAGVSSIDASAQAVTAANNRKMAAVVAGLRALGVAEDDMQTRQLSVGRIDYGPNRNRFEASNTVEVRIRDVAKAGGAIAAATQAGANILSGPNLAVGDPEAASRSAYAAAYKAARARADAYAQAADLKVARVLAIRDGGAGGGPSPYGMDFEMDAAAPRAVVAQAAPVMAGTSREEVSVSVDFALTGR